MTDKNTDEAVLFEVFKKNFNLQGPNGQRVPFNDIGLFRTSDPEMIKFLDAEATVHRAQDQSRKLDVPNRPGMDAGLRAKQLREFLANSKHGEGKPVTDGAKAAKFSPAPSTASPLTGGTNPASPRYSQAETIAALKGARVIADKAKDK